MTRTGLSGLCTCSHLTGLNWTVVTLVVSAVVFQLTARERRAVMVGVVSVFRHLVMGGLLVALDFLVFWMLDQVHHQVKGDVSARGERLLIYMWL